MTNYKTLGYDLNDLGTYQKFKFDETREKILKHLKLIYKNLANLDSQKISFFDTLLNYNDHHLNGTVKPGITGFYQGYVLLTSTKIVEVSRFPLSSFTKTTRNRDLLFILANSLNNLPMTYEPFLRSFYEKMNTAYENFIEFVLISLILIISFLVFIMIVTFLCILRLRKLFHNIYLGYTQINEGEYEERFRELEFVDSVLEKFKKSGYFNDFMGQLDNRRPKLNSKKKAKKYQDDRYCFRLLSSIFFIFLFYIIQVGFSCGMMLIFRQNVQKALWITNKQKLSKNVLDNQLILYNSIKQKFILGDESLGYNKSISQFLTEFGSKVEKSSDEIIDLFDSSQGNDKDFYPKLNEFLTKISNNSLCNFTPETENRKELCENLDRRIPKKGPIQVYFRMSQYLVEILKRISQNKDQEILKDEEFIEVEYTFENVYYPNYCYIEQKIQEFFKIYVVEQVTDSVNLIITLISIFTVISSFFMVSSFFNIVRQIKRVSFTFQLLSMDTVIQNTNIKMRFLEMYRLNQKHF